MFNNMTDCAWEIFNSLENPLIDGFIVMCTSISKKSYSIDKIKNNYNLLSDWEQKFFSDMKLKFHPESLITEKQINILSRIFTKLLYNQDEFTYLLQQNEWTNPIYVSNEVTLKAKFENGNIIFQCKPYQAKTISQNSNETIYEYSNNLYIMPLHSENLILLEKFFMQDFEFEVSNDLISYIENIRKPHEIRFYIKNNNIYGYEALKYLDQSTLQALENSNIYLRTTWLSNYCNNLQVVSNINDFKEFIVNPLLPIKERYKLLNFIIINYNGFSNKLINFLEDLNDNYTTTDYDIINALEKQTLIPEITVSKKQYINNLFNFERFHNKNMLKLGSYDKNFKAIGGLTGKLCNSFIMLRPFSNYTNEQFAQTNLI